MESLVLSFLPLLRLPFLNTRNAAVLNYLEARLTSIDANLLTAIFWVKHGCRHVLFLADMYYIVRISALDERETGQSHIPSILLDSCFVLVRTQQQQIIDVIWPQSQFLIHPKTEWWAGRNNLHRGFHSSDRIHITVLFAASHPTGWHTTANKIKETGPQYENIGSGWILRTFCFIILNFLVSKIVC